MIGVNRMACMKIDVLGTKYTIRRVNSGQDEFMDKMSFGGYCDDTKKEIVVLNMNSIDAWKDEPEHVIAKERETIRHELIHAFLSESGLAWNSFAAEKAWAKNEEMVDWFAIQFPKLLQAFKSADAL